jgi:glyoxylase-like metal-dependent hydrolase (beta-lactamase superfamily II)
MAFVWQFETKEGLPVWLKEPTRINDAIDYLGSYELCFYLVRGDDALIVGGGMNHVTPELERQLDELHFDASRVKYLALTHSHFDHCGALPYLRQRFPGLQVLGTAAAQQALAKPKVADYNARMNDLAAEQMGVQASCLCVAERVGDVSVDRVVSDGESLDLGAGISVEFYEVPGHSKCCLATYVPSLKALFPTDTTPHPVHDWRELSFPSAQYDFDQYLASLRRLIQFDVEILGLDHHGVMLGEQASQFLKLGLERALRFQKTVLARYAATQDLDEVAREVTSEAFPMVQLPFITEELMFVITRAMIKNIVTAAPR